MIEPLLPDATPRRGAGGGITGRWSTGWCGGPGRGVRGGTCRLGMGRGRRCMSGIAAGLATGRGSGCWTGCGSAVTPGRASGRWGSTRRWCGRISTPPAPATPRPPTCPPPGWSACWRVWRDPPVPQGALPNHNDPPPDRTDGDVGDRRSRRRADREGIGRSRGGLSTKIHLLADARARPLARVTTAGQRGDALAAGPLLDRLKVRRPGRAARGPGRAGCWATRPTPTGRYAPSCAAGASGR